MSKFPTILPASPVEKLNLPDPKEPVWLSSSVRYNQGAILMKPIAFLVGITIAIFGFAGLLPAQPKPGAPVNVPVTKKEVKAAAAFAIDAQSKVMQGPNGGRPIRLELVKILKAEEQVVAGINYRLRLNVKVDGKEKEADAQVWWQAWRKPHPYELTGWKWAGEKK
jgi:hypothetical protein